jgi:hypothetical protein
MLEPRDRVVAMRLRVTNPGTAGLLLLQVPKGVPRLVQ